MANEEHFRIFNQGASVWNGWRGKNLQVQPDLRNASLAGVRLADANLKGVNFNGANLRDADLSRSDLQQASFCGADLRSADLSATNLSRVNFSDADLRGVRFRNSAISGTTFHAANLLGADFSRVYMTEAIFSDNDLDGVKGLTHIRHRGPSAISVATLYKSGANIPAEFLRGCGVPDDFIRFLPSLIDRQQFYSCFISYSHMDEAFVKRLHARLRDEHILVWFAPEDIKGGEKIHEQINRAIKIHDKLLVVLSENSLQSEWVMTEIRNARKVEMEEGLRKLFPIRLVDFETLKGWKCFDAESRKDLAVEVREYFIPDFTDWKDYDSFESSFNRLLRDLKAEESTRTRT